MMDKREVIVEVTVICPEGETIDDWKFIRRFYENLVEGDEGPGSLVIAEKIKASVLGWFAEHPQASESADTTSVVAPKTEARRSS